MSTLESFARHWRMTGRAASTAEGYCYVLAKMARTLGGEAMLATLTREDLERYVEARRATVSPSAAAYDVRAIKALYRWLHDEGEVDVDPAARLTRPRVDDPPVAVATEQDYRRMLGACEKRTRLGRRDAAVLALLWHAGLRRAEVARLDLDDVDLDGREVRVARSKTGRPRTVPLHHEAVGLLDRWLRTRGYEPGALILARTGRRITSNGIGQMFAKRAEQAGVEVTPHAFRRALAARWLAAGGGEVSLQALAGWTSNAMVARYTRMQREELAHDEYRRLLG